MKVFRPSPAEIGQGNKLEGEKYNGNKQNVWSLESFNLPFRKNNRAWMFLGEQSYH